MKFLISTFNFILEINFLFYKILTFLHYLQTQFVYLEKIVIKLSSKLNILPTQANKTDSFSYISSIDNEKKEQNTSYSGFIQAVSKSVDRSVSFTFLDYTQDKCTKIKP